MLLVASNATPTGWLILLVRKVLVRPATRSSWRITLLFSKGFLWWFLCGRLCGGGGVGGALVGVFVAGQSRVCFPSAGPPIIRPAVAREAFPPLQQFPFAWRRVQELGVVVLIVIVLH